MAKLFSKDFFHFCLLLSILSILLPKKFLFDTKINTFCRNRNVRSGLFGLFRKKGVFYFAV